MLKRFLFRLTGKLLSTKIAYAHCDIPCGIYDPHRAQLAAHTIIRMTQLITDLSMENGRKAGHDLARMTKVKEDHGEIVEEELDTLENDYFKEEHFKTFPELEKMFQDAVKSSIKTRQTINMEAAEQLLETILKISEVFYKTKNLTPVRIKSPYPTERELVFYK